MASHPGLWIVALVLAGCSIETSGLGGADGSPGAPDGGARVETGIDPRTDAGHVSAGGDASSPGVDGGADAGAGVDAAAPDAGPPDAGPPDTGPVCPGGGSPMPETCNGIDDDCDGVRDEDDSSACGGSSKCLLWSGRYYCMWMACASDPCCSGTGTDPCMSPFSCEHVAFDPSDCPPECAGQCGNCHMCVRR